MDLLITTIVVVAAIIIFGGFYLYKVNSRSGGNDDVWRPNDPRQDNRE